MWEREATPLREAQEFADQHALTFHAEPSPALPSAYGTHPFSGWRRFPCVSGEWRGRTVQRFVADGITVELLALPRPLPRLQVMPVGTARGAMDIGGLRITTGHPEVDAQLEIYSDDPAYVQAFLDPAMREALTHPAFAGRRLAIDGDVMYLWTDASTSWDEARVRLELLSVLIARIPLAVWERFDRSGRLVDANTTSDALWVPEPEQPETSQWEYVEVEAPAPVHATTPARTPAPASAFDGAFLPEPTTAQGEYGNFAVAPIAPR